MAISLKINDPTLVKFYNQRETIYNGTKKQTDENIAKYEAAATKFKDFEEKVNSKDKLYQEATESFSPNETIVAELKECSQEYQSYKELLFRVSLLAENVVATINYLKPAPRSIVIEQEFQACAPELYAQVKESEKICLANIQGLETSLSKTLELKTKLLEQVNNPKIISSLSRFLGIVDNAGKPLPTAVRTFTDPSLLKFHTQCENSFEGIKKEIATILPELRANVAATETFTKQVREQGSAYQNATDTLHPKEVLQKTQQYCEKYHSFLAMREKVACLEVQISKTIQLLTPTSRSIAAEQTLKETNRKLYDETISSEDTCKGYAAQLEKSLNTIKELNSQLSKATEDTTTKWALVRICEIVKNGCQPLALTSRSMNFLSSYVCNQIIPKPEELKLPEPKSDESDFLFS